MADTTPNADSQIAVFVDCDNTSPDILEYALKVVAQFGRVVIRRGYGNHATLANRWQDALVRLAFTPCTISSCISAQTPPASISSFATVLKLTSAMRATARIDIPSHSKLRIWMRVLRSSFLMPISI